MSNKILSIYKSILSYSAMRIEDNGVIYYQLVENNPDTRKEISIDNQPLVFPDDRQFKHPDQKKLYFHPLCEMFIRGESEVIQCLREKIMIRINFVTITTIVAMLKILGSPALHRRLNEEQAELLKAITNDTDEDTSTNWISLTMKLLNADSESALVKLYQKHTGVWKGQPYARVGIVTFPFYKDLINGKFPKLRKKDEIVFRKVMEFVFPGIDKPETYNYGTRTRVAPYLDSLMNTTLNITSRLNEMNRLYHDFIDEADLLLFDTEWESSFNNLDDLRPEINSMPELKGNTGKSSVSEQQHPTQQVQSTPLPAPVITPAPQTQYNQPPTQHPIQNAPVPPTVRLTEEGKINFGDVLRANPAMSYVHNPLAPQIPPEVMAYYQQYGVWPPNFSPPNLQYAGIRPGAMAQTTPSWAQPNMPAGYPVAGYPAPVTYAQPQQPQYQPQPIQMQQPPPGYQWVPNPATNQMVLVPLQSMQPQYQPQPQYQQPTSQMPPGWDFNRR